ncbi:MAG TPA: pyridoxamine 5'-phosphate oxidase family protein [Actinomycetota bacterium]|nr:pyridoxamine 5'-phosphate oxidase family protein [Actinomycetota bacterium]
MDPRTEQLDLPKEYGEPKKQLDWADVRRDLEDATVYWVASTRPDGRPHVVPRDGVWLDDSWYYGGSPKTVHNHNLETNPAIAMHIGDGMKAIMVEGESHFVKPPQEIAEQLAEISNRKYAHYGMNNTPETYTERGIWALKARRVIAWNVLFEDATRFVFPE